VDVLIEKLAMVTGDEIEQTESLKQRRSIDIGEPGEIVIFDRQEIHHSLPPDAEEKESPLDKAMRSLAFMRQRDNALYWGYILEIL
jgi:hypothetical protein